MNKVVLRDIKPSDIQELKKVLEDTWDFSVLVIDNLTLDAMLSIYLNSIIKGCSFGKIATINNQVIGFILGSIKGDSFNFDNLLTDEQPYNLIIDKATEHDKINIKEFFTSMPETYNKMINEISGYYDGCIEFLAVSKKARGLKAGKMLLNELLIYFKVKNVKRLYLFTDEDCNYGFYDYNGFEKKAEKNLSFKLYSNTATTKIFLYDYSLS